MKKAFKIFFAAKDPGGVQAVLPVFKKLKRREGFLLRLFLDSLPKEEELFRIFRREKPDLVFTATSQGRSIEKKLVKIAKKRRIKTISFVDFWSNYKSRFGGILPDYILVIDRTMKEEMAQEGFNPKRLVITGSPFFDQFSSPDRFSQREGFFTFFSQPRSGEVRALKDLVEVLGRLKFPYSLRIKFHPREKKLNKFDRLIKKSRIGIDIERKLSAKDLIKKSRLVMGINSMALFQAALMGRPVLSYQPNLKGRDPLVSNRLGLSTPVYKKNHIPRVVKKLLSGKADERQISLIRNYTQNHSTQKVINFIINILKDGK